MYDLLTPELQTALTGAVAAAVYAAIWYGRARRNGEKFEPRKFTATVLVGAAIGFITAAAGNLVTFDTIQEQLIGYAGAVSLVEGLLKTLWPSIDHVVDKLPRPGK